MAESFRFDRFALNPGNRQLRCDDAPVEINSRYLDALTLLVRERGNLVSKERFLEEVWRGVPVTDEALTQCIKSLRKLLGDDASAPRFIETVPKHGYRFIAPVSATEPQQPAAIAGGVWRAFLLIGAAGLIGGGAAGTIGGLFYGFAGATDMGGVSALFVLVCVSMLIGLLAGIGVGFGIAAGTFASERVWQWSTIGGAAGGLIIGAIVKLIGVDTFTLFLGQSPGDIAGAAEGALLGAAVGGGCWLASRARTHPLQGSLVAGGVFGGVAGILIALIGGRLMGGSLESLAERFPNSRLRLDQIGAAFGETHFGPITQAIASSLEGMLFGACMVTALLFAWRSLNART